MSEKKSWTRSSVAGGVVGAFAGGIVVLVLEALGHKLFGTVDPGDLSGVTVVMWASLLGSWVIACAVAGGLATYWARSSSLVLGAVMGLFLLAGSITNFVAFPHPLWMMIAAVVLMPAAAILSARRFVSTPT